MLVSISVRGFRNLEPLEWTPGAGSHLLYGGNGAGKTSVLEAIYVLSTTRSFRTARLEDCARWGGARFELAGRVEGDTRVDLEVGWRRSGAQNGKGAAAAGEKHRRVNGKAASLGEHLGALPVVVWTAADAELTTGPPKPRRRFLDRGVVSLQPGSVDLMGRYRRALSQKRELLARGRRPRPQDLAPWNQLLAGLGAEIAARRAAYAERLAAALAAVEAEAGLPFPPLSLAYRPSPRAALAGAESLASALEEAAGHEIERRRPLIGPQRDDLVLGWGEHSLRGIVSAGERKTSGLLLAAAHGRVMHTAGRSPLYLLDDADAELAPSTLAAVWTVFAGAEQGAEQLFASSNRPQVWEGLEVAATHRVESGRIEPAT